MPRRDRKLIRALAAAAAACLGLAACASAPPPPSEDAQQRVERVLAEWRTRNGIVIFVGREPRCVTAGPTTELCEWPLSNRIGAWQSLAAALGTEERVRLICELPLDGSPREDGACTAHPMRSNRDHYGPAQIHRNMTPDARSRRISRREVARLEVDAARTLPALSRLVGKIPDVCEVSGAHRVCLWRVNSRAYGHGTLATSIGAPPTKKVQLRCRVPADGSRRKLESCTARVGS